MTVLDSSLSAETMIFKIYFCTYLLSFWTVTACKVAYFSGSPHL